MTVSLSLKAFQKDEGQPQLPQLALADLRKSLRRTVIGTLIQLLQSIVPFDPTFQDVLDTCKVSLHCLVADFLKILIFKQMLSCAATFTFLVTLALPLIENIFHNFE